MGPGATVNSIIAAMRSDQSTTSNKTKGEVIISHFQDIFPLWKSSSFYYNASVISVGVLTVRTQHLTNHSRLIKRNAPFKREEKECNRCQAREN